MVRYFQCDKANDELKSALHFYSEKRTLRELFEMIKVSTN